MSLRFSDAVRRTCMGVLVMVTSIAASSQLKPCKTSIPASPYKVYVDAMPAGPSLVDTEQVKNLKARIGVVVGKNLAQLKFDLMDTELKQQKTLPEILVIPCDGSRFPENISVFTDKEMKGLSESRVLLEIWGSVLNPEEGVAYMGYALAPATKVQLPGVYSIRQNIGKPATSPEQLFHEDKILQAYAEVVVGIQFYRNDDFDAAAGYLCSGALNLDRTLKLRPAPVTPEDRLFVRQQEQLIAGVRALGEDSIKRATQNPNSSISAVSAGTAACPAKEN